jgi:cobalt/nickel transport system permease protein
LPLPPLPCMTNLYFVILVSWALVRYGTADWAYMHIPDGYLSPSTCFVLYAAAAPCWYVALQRLKRVLHTRVLPLVSVFAAFSFVVMMFNLPLPGGTTGHAVGVGIAAIVLGPWGAMLALSVALTVQALFFGDGGITALGANCFNIAVAGSLVAYAVYRVVAHGAAVTARRRVVAAALAGYVAINVSALLTGLEMGVQPLLFKDAGGAPLYAPYPLEIAVPAMLLGHLTLAGLAEMIVSAGLVSYFQRTNPALLERTAGRQSNGGARASVPNSWRSTRPLWAGLALLMIATPLGLFAAGSAWGEWEPAAFAEPEMRAHIQAASGDNPPPPQAPAGMERLAALWNAPFAGYTSPFLRSKEFGYVMAAMLGVGVILLTFLLVGWIGSARLAKVGGNSPGPPEPGLLSPKT